MLKPIIAVEGSVPRRLPHLSRPLALWSFGMVFAQSGITQIAALLALPKGERQTSLDRLPRGPSRVSGPALVHALQRVDAIRLFEVEHLDLSFLPRGRVRAWRFATTAVVYNLRQHASAHRLATLLSFAHTYLAVVHDDALDLFRCVYANCPLSGQAGRATRTLAHDPDP